MSTTEPAAPPPERRWFTAANLYLVVAAVLLLSLLAYFATGHGGARWLATRLLPVAIVLWALRAYLDGGPYPWFAVRFGERTGRSVNRAFTVLYSLIALTALAYFWSEYDALTLLRSGSYTTLDLVMGSLVLLLVFEISRTAHFVLFVVNLVLVAYALWGSYLPMGSFFWHPGASLERIVTSSTVEFSTGVFGGYTQMALTLIAAFLLLAAVARGFGGQEAIMLTMQRLVGQRRRTVPLTTVLASVSVGMVTGSAAANAAVTGGFTIPLMKRHGLRGRQASAVETAASMGGLMLPPLMAVAGFIMADILQVPYWEVALRGFGISAVYFVTLSLAVYLLSVRRLAAGHVPPPVVGVVRHVKTGLFFGAVIALILLLGVAGFGEMRAALYAATLLFSAMLLFHFVQRYLLRDTAERRSLARDLRVTVETFAELTWYLVILMATLGIMIGLFTLTGFILRMGSLMLDLASWSIVLTVLTAFLFGWLVGTGLPPTATYIIVAVVVVQPLVEWGIDPWVAHFFAFMLAIWGELSPPTSLTAAVASRIADASFMATMWEALKLCLPIVLVTFGIFVRTDAVVTTGWAQIGDVALLTLGCLAMTFAAMGHYHPRRAVDVPLRVLVALCGAVVLFLPGGGLALGALSVPGTLLWAAAAATVALLLLGLWRCSGERAVSEGATGEVESAPVAA
ncbi:MULTISPECIES: TRAP transporter fused permease subunit [unclassified Nocardiopsis]|uniref:TRAP transporter fused permease subunit n=1 Tax=Nocardiopsis TaxID=2013 RepID=UPI00387B2874